MKLSKRLIRDPSQSGWIVRGFEKELTRLLQNLKPLLREAIFGARELAVATDPEAAQDRVVEVVRTGYIEKASRVGSESTTKAYKQGQKGGAKWLRAAGVMVPLEAYETPADTLAIAALRTRNIGNLTGLGDEVVKNISRELTDGILKGEGAQAVAKRIDGVIDDGIVRARLIARTEVMYAYNTAAQERYRAAGIAEVEWLTAYDERVCDLCASRNGKRYKIGEVECPAHPDCRCVLLPVVEEAS